VVNTVPIDAPGARMDMNRDGSTSWYVLERGTWSRRKEDYEKYDLYWWDFEKNEKECSKAGSPFERVVAFFGDYLVGVGRFEDGIIVTKGKKMSEIFRFQVIDFAKVVVGFWRNGRGRVEVFFFFIYSLFFLFILELDGI